MKTLKNESADRALPFTASDLPIDADDRIYHLQIKPEQLAPNILLVGDPGRAHMIAQEFFQQDAVIHEHRGLVTVTGSAHLADAESAPFPSMRTIVATSGMGTPSLEIVLQELAALNEIDFRTRAPKASFQPLQLIRVGTCGGLQSSTALGTPIITSYAIGMDNSGLFYDVPYPDPTCQRLEKELADLFSAHLPRGSRYAGKIQPYVSRTHPALLEALQSAAQLLNVPVKVGLTVSCSGFFAAQGRNIARVAPSLPDLDQLLADYDPNLDGQRIENMEMETSFLTHFMGGLGYPAASICTTIANRRADTFLPDYQPAVANSIKIALLAMANRASS